MAPTVPGLGEVMCAMRSARAWSCVSAVNTVTERSSRLHEPPPTPLHSAAPAKTQRLAGRDLDGL